MHSSTLSTLGAFVADRIAVRPACTARALVRCPWRRPASPLLRTVRGPTRPGNASPRPDACPPAPSCPRRCRAPVAAPRAGAPTATVERRGARRPRAFAHRPAAATARARAQETERASDQETAVRRGGPHSSISRTRRNEHLRDERPTARRAQREAPARARSAASQPASSSSSSNSSISGAGAGWRTRPHSGGTARSRTTRLIPRASIDGETHRRAGWRERDGSATREHAVVYVVYVDAVVWWKSARVTVEQKNPQSRRRASLSPLGAQDGAHVHVDVDQLHRPRASADPHESHDRRRRVIPLTRLQRRLFAAATGSVPGSNIAAVGFLTMMPSTGVRMARMRISPITAVAVSRSRSTNTSGWMFSSEGHSSDLSAPTRASNARVVSLSLGAQVTDIVLCAS